MRPSESKRGKNLFSVLLAKSQSKNPSVVLLRTNDLLSDEIYNHVIYSIRKNTEFLREGAIVTVDLISCRVRTLPINR